LRAVGPSLLFGLRLWASVSLALYVAFWLELAARLESVPRQLRLAPEQEQPTCWIADRISLHRICAAAIQRLIALPAEAPSLRLLADQTPNLLAGMMRALNGLSLLVADPATRVAHRGSLRPSRARLAARSRQCRARFRRDRPPSRCSGSSPPGRAARRQSASLRSS
jgi:hypothetical protein